MKIFIDLGAYNGDTLEQAIRLFGDFDYFYAFEPFEDSFNEMKEKFSGDERVRLVKKAASDVDGKEKLFLKAKGNEGHSLCSKKSNVTSKSIEIESIDFSKYLEENFSEEDTIVLKVNIEGAEYKMFDKMISDGTIKYIDRIFCEWHYFKVSGVKRLHDKVVKGLQDLGYELTGHNSDDAFVGHVNKMESKNE
jgi:FkbM family methyltransferase